MQFVNFVPHPELRHLVANFGIMYADFEQSGITTTYSFPWSAQVRLNFSIGDPSLQVMKGNDGRLITLPACSLIGPQLCQNTLFFAKKCVTICLCFNHGGFHNLTGIPVHEIVDRDLDAGLVFGNGIWQVSRELQTASSPAMMKKIIESFFLKRLRQRPPTHEPFARAMASWASNNGNTPVHEVAAAACLSIRHFERKCYEQMGITPKLFARLIRFSKAYAIAEQQTGDRWTGIAYDCGYYDQMHLIQDFKKFAGITPSTITENLDNSLKLIHILVTDPDTHLLQDAATELPRFPHLVYRIS